MLIVEFQLPVKGIHLTKRHFCGSVDIGYARLQLQEILPSTLFISLGVRFVAHKATILRSGSGFRKNGTRSRASAKMAGSHLPQTLTNPGKRENLTSALPCEIFALEHSR